MATTPENKPKPKAKKVKKNIQSGIAHITASFNNTIVTITDVSGNVVSWSSSGVEGLQGLAQVDAVRGATGRRGRRTQGDGARHAGAVGVRARARIGTRISSAGAGGHGVQDLADSGLDPHPAQRMSAAEAASGLNVVKIRKISMTTSPRTLQGFSDQWLTTPDRFAASAGART